MDGFADWHKLRIEARIPLKLKPLEVPMYVDVVLPSVPGRDEVVHPVRLSEVDAITLARLCDDYRAELFRRAGKAQPPTSD